jgi:hypothetical protein
MPECYAVRCRPVVIVLCRAVLLHRLQTRSTSLGLSPNGPYQLWVTCCADSCGAMRCLAHTHTHTLWTRSTSLKPEPKAPTNPLGFTSMHLSLLYCFCSVLCCPCIPQALDKKHKPKPKAPTSCGDNKEKHDCLHLGAEEGDCAWCEGDFMPASCVATMAAKWIPEQVGAGGGGGGGGGLEEL